MGLESADKESFKAWIAAHSLESHQKILQSIFREIAVEFIELHYDEIYRDGYEKQLYDAYGDSQDDTFRSHPHIAHKFNERGLSPNSLSEWWQTEGKATYFANMRHASWAWGGESEIDALARYLGVTLFWQKGGGSRTVGGSVIEGLTEEQIKQWIDLEIGERVGRSFQLHRFDRIEDLQGKMQPIGPSETQIVERVLDEKELTALDFPQAIPGQYRKDPILQLKQRGVLTEGNRLLADEQGHLAVDQIRHQLSSIQDHSLRNKLLDAFRRIRHADIVQRALAPSVFPVLPAPALSGDPSTPLTPYLPQAEAKDTVVNAAGLKVTGHALDITVTDIWMPNAQVNVEDHIHIQAEEEAHLPRASLKVSAGGLAIEAPLLLAPELHAASQGGMDLQGSHIVNLNKADLKGNAEAHIEGDYLLLKQSKIASHSINEKGHVGIAAENSFHKAEAVLSQSTAGSLHLEKAIAEAGERIAQEADVWIDHVEATNKAPLNVIRTNLLHNQKGTYEGDLIGEINTFENEAGHLKLGAEMSSLKVETMRSSAESSIVGKGGIQILSSKEFHEKGEVKLGDAYQVQVQSGNLNIGHDVLAKNVHLQAVKGKVGVSEGVTILISEKGTLDGNQLDNRGLVESAGSLEIYQKQYQDPGAVRGEKLLKLYSVSPIDLKQPMQTSGDLAIISEKMVHVRASLDVENNLFLKGTGESTFGNESKCREGESSILLEM